MYQYSNFLYEIRNIRNFEINIMNASTLRIEITEINRIDLSNFKTCFDSSRSSLSISIYWKGGFSFSLHIAVWII